MNRRFPFPARAVLPLLLILSAAGCGREEGKEPPRPAITATEGGEESALPARVGLPEEERKSRVGVLEEKMSALGRRVDELRAGTLEGKRDLKKRVQKRLRRLEKQRRLAEKRLRELKKAGGEAWEGCLILVEDTLERLEKASEKAASKLGWGE